MSMNSLSPAAYSPHTQFSGTPKNHGKNPSTPTPQFGSEETLEKEEAKSTTSKLLKAVPVLLSLGLGAVALNIANKALEQSKNPIEKTIEKEVKTFWQKVVGHTKTAGSIVGGITGPVALWKAFNVSSLVHSIKNGLLGLPILDDAARQGLKSDNYFHLPK